MAAVWHGTGVKSIEDAKRIEVIMGATGAAGTKAGYAAFLNNTLGTKFKIVTGYNGTAEIALAMERGEVSGIGDWSWTSLKKVRPDWLRANQDR